VSGPAHREVRINIGNNSGSDDASDSISIDVTPIVEVLALAGATFGLYEFFDWLLGGSDNPPPIPRQLRHHRHPLYSVILGIPEGLIPDEASVAFIFLVPGVAPSNISPLPSANGYPPGIVPVYDKTGGPENSEECGTARGSAWLGLNTAKDIGMGGYSGAKTLGSGAVKAGLPPEAKQLGLGLGALGGMVYGAYQAIQDYESRCLPKKPQPK
jgi:hypothetical protein